MPRITQRTRRAFMGSMTMAAVVAVGACAPADAPAADESAGQAAEITVGMVTSETGLLGGYGKQYLEGFRAGLDYVTEGTGQINGTKVTVEYKDDAGDPDKAVTAAKDLIGSGVKIIAGSASSGSAQALAEQAEQNKVLFISGAAAGDNITGINDYTFRSGRQSAQDVATAGTFLDDIEGKKITVFAQNTAFGKGNQASVEALLGQRGAKVTSILVAEDVTEFTPFARQVLAESPDLVFVAWAGATSGSMWQALNQQGVLEQLPVVTGLGDIPTYGAYGEGSADIKFLSHYFAGAAGTEIEKEMIKRVEAAGGTPDVFTPDGFTTALLIARAIEAEGGDVPAMIKALEGYSFDGPKGPTTVRASDHALLQNMYQAELVKTADGFEPKLVGTVPAAEVAPVEKTK